MALETASVISELNPANPTSGDPIAQGDNHIRLIKTVLKNTFPNLNMAITADPGELNKLDGMTASKDELNHLAGVTSPIQTQINSVLSTITGLTTSINTLTSRTISAGDGMTGGGDLSANRTLAVDSTVVRTTGDQTLAGVKTFSNRVAANELSVASLIGGLAHASDNDGSFSSGSYTPNPADGNFKQITNTGAFSIISPTAAGAYSIVIELTNGTGAGAVTLTGFTRVFGAPLTTTVGHRFHLMITKTPNASTVNIVAMQ